MSENQVISSAEFKQLGRYVGDFFACKCAPDLLKAGIYPNVKEITESAAAHYAARNHLPVSLRDKNISVVCVGDGRTPRTAAMFALRSAWTAFSVDPNLKLINYDIKRLYQLKYKIEIMPLLIENDTIVIVAVHSHAPLEAALDRVKGKTVHVIAIPCCVPQKLFREPDEIYCDPAIWSKKNKVLIWRDVK